MGRVCLLLAPLTAKQVRFDDRTGLSASKWGFAPDLDLLASFPHDLHHENDVSGRSQRACARATRKATSYPYLMLKLINIVLAIGADDYISDRFCHYETLETLENDWRVSIASAPLSYVFVLSFFNSLPDHFRKRYAVRFRIAAKAPSTASRGGNSLRSRISVKPG